MKHSIRVRFSIIFVGLMALVLISVWCANHWFLETFYTREKVQILETVYAEIDKMAVQAAKNGKGMIESYYDSQDSTLENESSAQKLFRLMGEKYNLMMVFIDSSTDEILVSAAGERQFLKPRVDAYIFGRNMPAAEILKEHDNYIIQKSYDKGSDSYYLESWGYFSDNNTIFLISVPFASIRESADIANRFLTHVGMAALLFGSLFVYFTTKKITSPILQLADLSGKMSALDFEAHYSGPETDEIGVLGNSMNKLSQTLKDTIGKLQEANLEFKKDIE